MKEIEIRSVVTEKESIIKALKELLFENKGTVEQHDIILDKKDASLFKSGQKIRIRVENDKCTLTYKSDMSKNKEVSLRDEINIDINKKGLKDYLDFFENIGFTICFQIKKTREIWKYMNIKVTIDKWPIIGYIVEIEGNEEDIKRVANIIAPDKIFKNYRLKELFESKMKETGKSLKELKMIYYEETGFDLGNIELIIS